MSTAAPTARRWLVAAAVVLPTVMEVLDTSIVNVALPYMAGSLSADTSEATWILTSYLVSNAIVLPLTFWLSRLFGRRAFLLACVALFTLASVLCATADSLTSMIVLRVAQGAAGGALQPLSQAILLETFPGEDRGQAMALWGMGIVTAPVVAPLLGGYLTLHASWRWIFLINAPVGLVAFLALSAFVSDPPHARRDPLPADAVGIALLITGLGSLQVVLDKGQEWGWWGATEVRVLAIVAAVSLVGLVAWELRHRGRAVLDLALFRDRNFGLGTGIMFLFGFALYGTLTLFPLFMQTLLGYSPLDAGIVMAPRGLGVMVTMAAAGVLLRRHDPRRVILAGFPLLVAASVAAGFFSLDTQRSTFAWVMVVQGLGLGFVFVPLTTVTMSSVSAERTTSATGLFNLMRNVGGAFGVSLTQTILARAEQLHHHQLARFVNPYDPAFLSLWNALAGRLARAAPEAGDAHTRALAAIAAMVERQAATLAYEQTFWALAAAVTVMVPLVLALRRTRPGAAVVAP